MWMSNEIFPPHSANQSMFCIALRHEGHGCLVYIHQVVIFDQLNCLLIVSGIMGTLPSLSGIAGDRNKIEYE